MIRLNKVAQKKHTNIKRTRKRRLPLKGKWGILKECPECKRPTYSHCCYREYGIGIVEEHGKCTSCGLLLEMAYSPILIGFRDIKKGFGGIYHNKKYYIQKDEKRHKRIRRKNKIKPDNLNARWTFYV